MLILLGAVDLNFAMAVEPTGVTLMKLSVRDSKIPNVKIGWTISALVSLLLKRTMSID